MTVKLCTDPMVWTSNDLIVYCISVALFFPVIFIQALIFLRKLITESSMSRSDPMYIATMIYIFLSTLAISLACYYNCLQPMSQLIWKNPSLQVCRTVRFFNWYVNGVTSWSLLEIYIIRLSTVFKSTSFKVSPTIQYTFRSVFVAVGIMCAVMIGMSTEHVNCFGEVDTGFLGQTPLFPRVFHYCVTDVKYAWLVQVPMIVTMVVPIISTLTLLYMFITRLYKLDELSGSTVYSSVISKSMIVCIVAMLSSLISFLIYLTTDFVALLYLDHIINLICLFCMFKFGDPLYHWLFDGLEAWVQRMRSRMSINESQDKKKPSNALSLQYRLLKQ